MIRNALPKPPKGTAAKAKAADKRRAATVAKYVRAACVERDGHCLIATRVPGFIAVLLGPCAGPSEWAHVGEHRRCHTRGQAPERRHTTAGSGMMCAVHHRALDAHQFDFMPGGDMNGAVVVIRRTGR